MKRHGFLLVVTLLVACASGHAQTTGYPPYGSFDVGRFDGINRQNLNVNFAIPIVSVPGRGTDFNFSIVYDSLIWRQAGGAWVPVTNPAGTSSWGWKTTAPIGAVSYKYITRIGTCRVLPDYRSYTETDTWSNYVYTDPLGTPHSFSVSYSTNYNDCTGTTTTSSTPTGYASDGSGYYIDIGSIGGVWSRAGIKITGATLTDTNGNFISGATPVGTNETDWTDTAGHTALRVVTTASTTEYHYLDTTGTDRVTTLNLQTFNIKTNFGCSGVVEHTGTASLPSSIVLPNGKSYSFTYEPTPGFAGYYTGRVQTIALPTGGSYEYDYTGANDSINCSDATVTSLTRKISDGTTTATWQFTRSGISASGGTTTVTAPQLPYDSAANQSVFTFNTGGQLTTVQIYQGTAAGTPLRTINTTWAANGTPASNTVILENNQQSQTQTDFDTNANLLALREYAWGTGAPGSLARNTALTYLSASAYTAWNLVNRVTQKLIQDGSGTTKYRQDISYDATSLTCVTGAAQHDDTNYGCTFTTRGNPTSATTYTDAATPGGPITKNFYYDSVGNLRQADVDCCQQEQWNYSLTTNYAYPDSVVRGPSGSQLTTSGAYNSSTGLIASATDENSKTTSFSYDLMKRVTGVTRPDGAQISYGYDDTNLIVTTTSPLQAGANVKQLAYFDGLGRYIKTTAADGSGVSYSIVEAQYDSLGRAYKTSNPHNSTAQYWTETRFDGLGRVTKTILPDGQQTAYSYAGSTATVTDPAGKQRKTDTDALGRLATMYEPDPSNGNLLTQQTTYGYTVLDALASVGQVVQTRTYNYDGLGRLASQSTPEGGTWQYSYNSFSLVTQRTDARGVMTSYGYDTLNRLTSVSYNVASTGVPATASVSYTYGSNTAQNNNGRLVSITDGVGSETYAYDANLPVVTQVQKVVSGTTYTTGYAYNLAGELTLITYPSGRVVQPSYDAVGRLSTLAGTMNSVSTTYASGYAYNPAFQVTGMNYGNGVAASFGYSPDRLQLTSLSYAQGATTLFSLTYGYTQGGGNNGQITSISDNVDAGRTVSYTYDALSRLSTALTTGSTHYPQWGLSWTYDRYGNRTAQSVTAGSGPSNAVNVSATTNRLTDPGYGYDPNGNMTNDGLNALSYDAENRLVTSSGSTYSYDGNSLRVKKSASGTTTVYVFSGTKVIAEYDNGAAVGSPSREYIYSGGALLAKIESGATVYYHPDHLSVRATTDSSGNVAGQQGHYPFGESWYSASTTTKWQFTSYERDAESGNDYAVFRYNVNRLGRFSSPDLLAGSVTNPQSLNRYAYVRNNSVSRTDPLGLNDNQCDPTAEPCGKIITECAEPGCAELGGGDVSIDGILASGFLASAVLSSGAGVQCPNNFCSGFVRTPNAGAVFVQFDPDTGSYYKPSDFFNAAYIVNGIRLTNAEYTAYILARYAGDIGAQKVALAAAIASNSGGKISYEEALGALEPKGGFLQGGNYNFVAESLGPNSLVCQADRCDGIHFVTVSSQQFVHLDAANPFSGLRSFFAHAFVDVFLGNVFYTVIPRP